MSAQLGARGCPRAWEVEAARDGRLRAKDVDSLQRHLGGCESCQRLRQRFETLGSALRELPEVPDDVLAARRTRHLLLAEADQQFLRAPGKSSSRRWVVAGAVVMGVAAIVTAFLGLRRGAARRASAVAPSTQEASSLQIKVQAEEGAVWHKTQRGAQARLELQTGEIRASVGARFPGQSLVIQLPDGEIDDLGTVLAVRVEQGRTRSVRVFEGRVRLRLNGRAALELGAGDSWLAQPPPTAPAPPPSCSAVAPAPARAPRVVAAAPPQRRAVAGSVDEDTAPSTPRALTAETDLSAQQSREEDEAYLHIVALVGAHQLSAARAAAKDYLLRFPKGFRREEVLGVATSVGR